MPHEKKNKFGHDIIVGGASAGGVEALSQLVQTLPADLAAAVFIVLHLPADSYSVLPQILSRNSVLPAQHPADGQVIENGHIYIAPPNFHLIVERGHIRLTRGPTENAHRPAVDPLFESAAVAYGSRVIGVILTGTMDDGTAGLIAVKAWGGISIVQDPTDAMFAGMPRNAIENAPIDHILPLAEIGPKVIALSQEPAGKETGKRMTDELSIETKVAEFERDTIETPRAGVPSAFACPECHGVLWETDEKDLLRFRCRVGHAYSPEALVAEQSKALEAALWTALRALEEQAALAEKLMTRAEKRGYLLTHARFAKQAEDAKNRAKVIRIALLKES